MITRLLPIENFCGYKIGNAFVTFNCFGVCHIEPVSLKYTYEYVYSKHKDVLLIKLWKGKGKQQ